MNLLALFHKLSLKSKLIAAFIAVTVPVMGLGSYISYAYLKQTYITTTRQELKNNADALVKMIETTASVAIQNYLRAVAEKNLETVEGYFKAYQSGRIDKEQMIARAHGLFGSQTIGRTGYIYCVDSQGVAVYHPHPPVQGKSHLHFPFIREQIRKKSGYLEYDWKKPDDAQIRSKALYMVYFEPMDWIISVSTYREEFNSLINISDIRENILALQFGGSGYAFVTDRSGGLLIHPDLHRAQNITEITGDGATIFSAIQSMKTGDIRYDYQDPVSKKFHPKVAYFDFIEDYGWYVGASYPEDEILKPLATIRVIIVLTAVVMLALAMAVAIWFSSYVNGHIGRLADAFEKGASGYFKARLQTQAKDEFGRLSRYFNVFMKRQEGYQQTLLEEIDKRREMQNTIYESNERLKTIIRNAPVMLWAIDRDGILTFYEGTLPAQTDHCQFMAAGQPLKEQWAHWEELGGHIDRTLAGQSGSLLIDRPDYAIEIHSNALLGGDSQIQGAVGVVIDVTSLRQAQRKLTAAEQEHQKLVMAIEQAADIIVITDTAGKIEYVNPAFEKSSGYLKIEAIGRNPKILKSGRHDQLFYKDLWRTISAGRIWSGRIVNRKKDGDLFYEDATIAPLRNEKGQIVNYVAAKRDVTQEVILENQLQHSQRMKAIGTLAGGIAHDFNNILAGILGYTEICLYETPKESALASRLGKILQAGLRAKELISHIQTFSRQSTVEPVPMLPAPVVTEAVKLIRASFSASIAFKCEIDDVRAIHAVPAQVHQIVMNLCTNACHAMQDHGGLLTVTLSSQSIDAESARRILGISAGDFAVLTVTDTGHGIPKDIIGRIFDPYFTTKAERQGTGLGLAVVHGIVKSLAGALKVYSETGLGTTFRVYLPLLSSGDKPADQRQASVPLGKQECILLVDDEEYVLDATREMLESLNYRVFARSSTRDALELFKAQPDRFDMVITDLSVPQMNGIEFASAVRQLRPEMPIIIATGFSYDERLEKIESEGMADLINKPIIRAELASKMDSIFQRGKSSSISSCR